MLGGDFLPTDALFPAERIEQPQELPDQVPVAETDFSRWPHKPREIVEMTYAAMRTRQEQRGQELQ